MNQVVINGKAWDPETKITQSGMTITTVNVSVYKGKDSDGKAKYDSYDVKAFKELAEALENEVREGDNIIVAGRLTVEKWEQQDGQKRRKVTVIADCIGKDIRFKNQDNHGFGGESYPEEAPF